VIGPTSIGTWSVVGDAFSHIGLGHSTLTSLQSFIVWQLRAPRMVMGCLLYTSSIDTVVEEVEETEESEELLVEEVSIDGLCGVY